MPLFVPVLRSAMLFMNIYESYKTLKPPPMSTRDPKRPSLRAATQRKRDLKGCLAVWIVWCCFTIYERFIEGFVNIFVPFYDELKSIGILFLILTRARGAEPIFLHILRPLIRPYDASIDGTLDVLRMTGDFLFALASLPVTMAINWLDQQTFFGLRAAPKAQAPPEKAKPQPVRRTSADSTHTVVSSGVSPHVEDHLTHRHQIWHPPKAAYDEEDEVRRPPKPLFKEPAEWRKYPDFPSAYPSTPMNSATPLSAAPSLLSPKPFAPIPEESLLLQQDFPRSLKPSRKPSNPGYADLSDQDVQPSGILQHDGLSEISMTVVDVSDCDESMTDASYEEEDSFNKTLRTPEPLRRSALQIPVIPMSSFPSQSTAVGSVDTAFSLQTGTMEEPPSYVLQTAAAMDEERDTAAPNPRRPRASPIRKRKVSQSPNGGSSSTSGTTGTEGTDPASSTDGPSDVYIPSELAGPNSKRPRVAGSTASRKGTIPASSTSRTGSTNTQLGRRTTPPRRPVSTRQVRGTAQVQSRAGNTTATRKTEPRRPSASTAPPIAKVESASSGNPKKAVSAAKSAIASGYLIASSKPRDGQTNPGRGST